MIRLGLSGCGAVTRAYYAPAIGRLAEDGAVRLCALFDPDPAAAAAVAAELGGAHVVNSFASLIAEPLDLVLLASPPQFHALQAEAALARGIPVHCEKPMARSLIEGERMVAAAHGSGKMITIGMSRRLLGPARMIGGLLATRTLGELQSIRIFEGGPFHWPVASADYFDRARGSGVLEDIGSHVLDLLHWWLGRVEVIAYSDDAMGGIEANCALDLRCGGAAVSVRLSRDWYRPNQWLITGSSGWLRWDLGTGRLELGLPEAGVGAELTAGDLSDAATVSTQSAPQFADTFALSIREAASGNARNELAVAEELLPTLQAIEQCRSMRQLMPMGWLQ